MSDLYLSAPVDVPIIGRFLWSVYLRITTGIRFTATRNAVQSIANNTETTIVFNNIVNDTIGGFDTTTGTYTIKDAGNYLFTVSAELVGAISAAQEAYLLLQVNGATVAGDKLKLTGGTDPIFSATREYSVSRNDTIRARIYQNSGGALNLLNSSSTTFLQAHRI